MLSFFFWQMQELNTAEDFISFYQEMFPLVQTLPQIILQRELIVSKLLSRLQIKSRLSLEPILRYSCKFGVYVCFWRIVSSRLENGGKEKQINAQGLFLFWFFNIISVSCCFNLDHCRHMFSILELKFFKWRFILNIYLLELH